MRWVSARALSARRILYFPRGVNGSKNAAYSHGRVELLDVASLERDKSSRTREVALPHYSDYHRTVVGYHGTRLSTAHEIIKGDKQFEASENNDDWLGHGIYFWEYAPQQAFVWARNRQASKKWGEQIAVLGSMIRLGNCFDLLDPVNVSTSSGLYKTHQATRGKREKSLWRTSEQKSG